MCWTFMTEWYGPYLLALCNPARHSNGSFASARQNFTTNPIYVIANLKYQIPGRTRIHSGHLIYLTRNLFVPKKTRRPQALKHQKASFRQAEEEEEEESGKMLVQLPRLTSSLREPFDVDQAYLQRKILLQSRHKPPQYFLSTILTFFFFYCYFLFGCRESVGNVSRMLRKLIWVCWYEIGAGMECRSFPVERAWCNLALAWSKI